MSVYIFFSLHTSKATRYIQTGKYLPKVHFYQPMKRQFLADNFFPIMFYNLLCGTILQAFLHVFFIFSPSSFLTNSHILKSVRWPRTHTPMNRARDICWTLDFASAFLSPGVNSRAELVPSPRAYARTALHAVGSGITHYRTYLWINID